jgi:DNA-binding beta-propeller fold protein YncE
VIPVDLATSEPGNPISVGGAPNSIAITPDGKTAYVASQRAGTVTPIATATNMPGNPIKVWPSSAYGLGGSPEAVAIMP